MRIAEERRTPTLRGCLLGAVATFVPERVYPGFLLWLCIRLHDTTRKCHTGASSVRTRARISFRFEILQQCHAKRGASTRFGMTLISGWTGTGSEWVNLSIQNGIYLINLMCTPSCKHDMKSRSHPGMELAPGRVSHVQNLSACISAFLTDQAIFRLLFPTKERPFRSDVAMPSS